MKIWFDILTPKQVMFFRRAVRLLRSKHHQVLCTSRQYREAIELAKIKQLDLKVVGAHGGSDRYEKLRQSSSRTFELAEIVHEFAPDVAVTFSSPEGARVAYGLGIKHIGFNDSPHAEAVARLSIPLLSKLLCPWVVPYSAWKAYGIARKNITSYHALDPAAWLKYPNGAASENEISATILIRLEESKASYVADKRLRTIEMVDALVDSFHRTADIAVLCRYEDQIAEVEGKYGRKVRILKHVVDGTSLVSSAELFVGAGGTMTAEAALLGKPTISIAPFNFYVENYLMRKALVKKAVNPKALVNLAKKMINDEKYQKLHKKRAAQILAAMEDPTDRLISAINAVRL